MRYLVTAFVCMLSFSAYGQFLAYDGNNDGCVNVFDILNILVEYGQCEDVLNICGDSLNYQGYDYLTVQIGDQCWFSENCHYLPVVSLSAEFSNTSPYYYVYDYDGTNVESAKATFSYEAYGVLYNWPAVMTENICPSGWHIPSDEEWTQLTDFLGGESVAGGMMKEAGYDHWYSPNTGATNSSGFSGLPGGFHVAGGFDSDGSDGYWWSSSESGSDSWRRSLSSDIDYINRYTNDRGLGFSARCVRD